MFFPRLVLTPRLTLYTAEYGSGGRDWREGSFPGLCSPPDLPCILLSMGVGGETGESVPGNLVPRLNPALRSPPDL